KRARKAFPSFTERFPQETKFYAGFQHGSLPPLTTTPGVTMAGWMLVERGIVSGMMSPKVMVRLLRQVRTVLRPDYFGLTCYLELAPSPLHPGQANSGWVSLKLDEEGFRLHVYPGGFTRPPQTTSGTDLQKYDRELRKYRLGLFRAVIDG